MFFIASSTFSMRKLSFFSASMIHVAHPCSLLSTYWHGYRQLENFLACFLYFAQFLRRFYSAIQVRMGSKFIIFLLCLYSLIFSSFLSYYLSFGNYLSSFFGTSVKTRLVQRIRNFSKFRRVSYFGSSSLASFAVTLIRAGIWSFYRSKIQAKEGVSNSLLS